MSVPGQRLHSVAVAIAPAAASSAQPETPLTRNVEIKAVVTDLSRVSAACATLATTEPIRLEQEDTFFHCPHGRLKLRKSSAGAGELIQYERPDEAGPKTSRYVRVPTAEPDRLRDALAAAYGILGVVRKQRTVQLVGRTRVHLDTVEGLGAFVEFEVVLGDADPVEPAVAEARRLMAALGIAEEQLVRGAYIDLLRGGAPPAPR